MQDPTLDGRAGEEDELQPPLSQINTGGGNYIGGNVTTAGGDFIGRDKIIQVFSQAEYTSLRDLYVPPEAVYERVRSREFVGRSWLIAQIDTFLNDPKRKCGVLVLEGEAGVGKSALMAHLVQQRNYLHLFAEQLPGDANVGRALQSLGSQIVAIYQLQEYTQRDTLPAIAGFPDFLERLLRGAAAKLPANGKLVVVCDALDEAGVAANGNVFGLPQVLPEGVYLLLSQRPQPVPLHFKNTTPQILRLDPASNENRGDVQAYLHQAARQPEIARQLAERGYSEERFVTILAERSGGVWMYLQYVIEEIAKGERAPLDLDRLPPGLAGYYADYWSGWREGKRGEGKTAWHSLYAPLLTTLAAAQAPLPFSRLLQWAGINLAQHDRYDLQELLAHQWHAFVTEVRREAHTAAAESTFSLYHASLRDFLSGKVTTDRLLPAARALVDELRGRTLDAHIRIIEALRRQCTGDWIKLVEDGYARLHLASHLHAAGERNPAWYQELYTLVAGSDDWAKAREAVEESYNGYLVDLNLLWQQANSNTGWNVGTQLRCALIQSSIFSLADNLTPELVALAVENKVWSGARALAHLAQVQDEKKRSETLTRLAPHLQDSLKREALTAARQITDEYWHAYALSGLVPHLSERLRDEAIREALAVAREIEDKYGRAGVLNKLIRYLPPPFQGEVILAALAATQQIKNDLKRAVALSEIAPHLPEALKGEALNAAREIVPKFERAIALSRIVPHLHDPLYSEIIHEAVTAIQGITNENLFVLALSEIIPHLPNPLRGNTIQEALIAARKRKNGADRAHDLVHLAPHLPDSLKSEAIQEAWIATCMIKDEGSLAYALRRLARHLPDSLVGEALATGRKIVSADSRTDALSGLVFHLPDSLKGKVIQEAIVAAWTIADDYSLASALIDLVPYLPDSLKDVAIRKSWEVARVIVDEYWRASALNKLVPYMPDHLKGEGIREAWATICEIEYEYNRADALGGLAPHLPDQLKGEAWAAVREIADEESRALALGGLAPHLPDHLKREALAKAREIVEEGCRAVALSGLAPYLADELKGEAIREAWATTCKIAYIAYKGSRTDALSKLSPHLPSALLIEELAATWKIEDDYWLALAINKLAPYLPEALHGDALAAARNIANEYSRLKALSGLAPYLDNSLKSEIAIALIVNVASRSASGNVRSKMLGNLITAWTITGFVGFDPQVHWLPVIAALARNIRQEQFQDLGALLPLIQHIGGQQAVDELFFAICDAARWWP